MLWSDNCGTLVTLLWCASVTPHALLFHNCCTLERKVLPAHPLKLWRRRFGSATTAPLWHSCDASPHVLPPAAQLERFGGERECEPCLRRGPQVFATLRTFLKIVYMFSLVYFHVWCRDRRHSFFPSAPSFSVRHVRTVLVTNRVQRAPLQRTLKATHYTFAS